MNTRISSKFHNGGLPMAAIRPDGRIVTDVYVRGSSTVTMTLVVDTGAHVSALPFVSLPPAVKAIPSSRPVTFFVAGTTVRTVRLRGASAETDVEPHGRGPSARTISPDIRVHLAPLGTAPFIGFD